MTSLNCDRLGGVLCRLGARLGNWNDAHSSHDSQSEATRRWRVLNSVAGWLYVKGDGAR